MKTLRERFESKVDRSGECHIWTAYRDCRGYGTIWDDGPKMAPRTAWKLEHGEYPEGLCVCHTCDNPACVNPDHLFLGTKGDNNRDRSAKDRTARQIGEMHGQSKLTESQVADILRLYAAGGVSQRALGEAFGITQAHVSDIVNGKCWSHLQPIIEGAKQAADASQRTQALIGQGGPQ